MQMDVLRCKSAAMVQKEVWMHALLFPKERQLAGIAKAKAEGKTWGGRRPGTRIKPTEEKEALIGQLHAEGKPVAAIARMVGLTRKTVYKAIGQEKVAC